MLIVTTQSIPGYRVDAVLGVVVSVSVRDSMYSADGIVAHTSDKRAMASMGFDAEAEALDRIRAEVERRGGNALIDCRLDTDEILERFSKVTCYGTAVSVVPIPQGQDGATGQSSAEAANLR